MNDLASRHANQPPVGRAPSASTSSSASESDADSADEVVQLGQRRGLQVPRDYRSIAPLSSTDETDPVSVSSLNAEDIGSSSNDLWAIKLPDGIKPKHLVNLTLDLRAFTTSTGTTTTTSIGPHKVGDLKVGAVDYEVFAECISPSDDQPAVGGQRRAAAPETNEMAQFVALVPDQRKDLAQTHLVAAPSRVSRVIFFRRRLDLPTSEPPNSLLTPPRPRLSSHKRPQPAGLETRYVPFGAESGGVRYGEMDRDASRRDSKRVKAVVG